MARRPMRPRRGFCPVPTAIALGVIGAIAGCASFGGNVKGNFACQAPGGICAPTSKIDDQALASMDRAETITPAPAALSAAAAVHSPRALKVVLPARQDRFGRWREPQVVYIEADPQVAMAEYASAAPSERLSLSELAAGAPDLAALDGAHAITPANEIKARVDAVLAAAAPRGSTPVPTAKPAPASQTPASEAVAAPSFPAASAEGLR